MADIVGAESMWTRSIYIEFRHQCGLPDGLVMKTGLRASWNAERRARHGEGPARYGASETFAGKTGGDGVLQIRLETVPVTAVDLPIQPAHHGPRIGWRVAASNG